MNSCQSFDDSIAKANEGIEFYKKVRRRRNSFHLNKSTVLFFSKPKKSFH